jgi:hypothetical protein
LSELRDLIDGSFFERYSTCSRPSCSCHKGKRHGPRAYLVAKREGRPRQIYIPQRLVGQAREAVGQHHRLLEIVDQITEINLRLMGKGENNESDDG